MNILIIVLLLVSLFVLIKSADIFVDMMESLSAYLKIPTFIVGLTVIAFGTSLPELTVSFSSIMSSDGILTLSNVVGANIVNILLIIGICAIINHIKVKNITIKKEIPLLIIITSVMIALFLDNL